MRLNFHGLRRLLCTILAIIQQTHVLLQVDDKLHGFLIERERHILGSFGFITSKNGGSKLFIN